MKMQLELDRSEVQREIPYALVCETRYGRSWNTGFRKRTWVELFSESERRSCERLFRQAHLWYLVRGVPAKVHMSTNTLALWKKLGDFCASL